MVRKISPVGTGDPPATTVPSLALTGDNVLMGVLAAREACRGNDGNDLGSAVSIRRPLSHHPKRLVVRVLLMLAISTSAAACDETQERRRAVAEAREDDSTPAVFYAVRDYSTEIVEVDTATGKVRRTLVDFGPPDAPQPRDEYPATRIETIDLSADGKTLYFGVFSRADRYSVYRLALPDGEPERMRAGRGPSVSPDGARLAFADESSRLHVQDLATGQTEIFEGVFGDFGGYTTAWDADSRWVAFESESAHSFSPGIVDTTTGTIVDPEPAGGAPAGGYYGYASRFRPADGFLAVLCCLNDQSPYESLPEPSIVFHDPATGKERERLNLPFFAAEFDYDPSGAHLLVLSGGRVYRHQAGEFPRVPDVAEVDLVAW